MDQPRMGCGNKAVELTSHFLNTSGQILFISSNVYIAGGDPSRARPLLSSAFIPEDTQLGLMLTRGLTGKWHPHPFLLPSWHLPPFVHPSIR